MIFLFLNSIILITSRLQIALEIHKVDGFKDDLNSNKLATKKKESKYFQISTLKRNFNLLISKLNIFWRLNKQEPIILKKFPMYVTNFFIFDSMESFQMVTLQNNFKQLKIIKKLLNQKIPLIAKQRSIELLDTITRKDLLLFQVGLSQEDKKTLSEIHKFLLPKHSAYWLQKNLKTIRINEKVTLSSYLLKKISKFQIIFDFFESLKKIINLDAALIFLYTLKSSILKTMGIKPGSSVKRTAFLGYWLNNLFKVIYSLTNNKSYFEIMNATSLIAEFSIIVLSEISDNYYCINCEKQIIRVKGKRMTPYFYSIISIEENQNLKLIGSHQLPLLIKPMDWNNDLQGGGYLSNSKNFYNGQHFKYKNGTFTYSINSIENLNYLQSMKFKINKRFLNLSVKDLFDLLISLLEDKFVDFIIELTNDKIRILNFESSSFFSKMDGKLFYDIQWKKINKWLNAFCLANEFQDFDLFTAWFFDSRARAYSSGFPLNAQGDKFTRQFFLLNVDISISLDSSCNGLSIIGGLLGEEELLIATNVLRVPGTSGIKKQDIYLKILERMLYVWNTKTNLFLNEEYFVGLNAKSIETLINFCKETLLISRDFAKSMAMVFPFNESDWSRINNINAQLTKDYRQKKKVVKLPFKEIRVIAERLNAVFLDSLYKLYPRIAGFQKILNSNEFLSSIKKNKCVSLKNEAINGTYTSFHSIPRRISKENFVLGRPVKSTIIENTGKLNAVKLRTSGSPNFVHSKDALILLGTVNTFRIAKKPISTVFDCFTVKEEDAILLKRTYFKNFIKYTLKSQYDLLNYLELNKVELNEEQIAFLIEVDDNKRKLLTKVKDNRLIMSDFILC